LVSEWLNQASNRTYIIDIRNALSRSETSVMVFLGAGLSFGAARQRGRYDLDKWGYSYDDFPFPSWDGLIRRMLEHLKALPEFSGREEELDEFFDQQDALDCAELFRHSVGKANFTQFLRKQFTTANPELTPSHEALAVLPVAELFTTNYDELIELAFKGRDLTVSIKPDQFIARLPNKPKHHLIKLHGSISQPDTIVLTRSQYADSRRTRVEMFDHLRGRLRETPFIFVGYSLTDPNFTVIHDEARLAMGPNMPPSYLVQGRGNRVRESYLRSLDVNVISLGTWNLLPAFLNAINPNIPFPLGLV